MCIHSDDYLTDDAVEKILKKWEESKDKKPALQAEVISTQCRFFIRKISLIVVVAGKDIRDFTNRNISERINVVYDVFHPDEPSSSRMFR